MHGAMRPSRHWRLEYAAKYSSCRLEKRANPSPGLMRGPRLWHQGGEGAKIQAIVIRFLFSSKGFLRFLLWSFRGVTWS